MATLKYRKSDGTFAALPVMAGPAGNGIASITQTSSSSDSGGSNVWTATMTNGTTATFTVKNGAQGAKGDKGDNYGDGIYLPLTGGTVTGALNFANNTWNILGDDARFGDNNVAGHFCIEGVNGATGIQFNQYNGTNVARITYDGSSLTSNVSFYGAVWNDYAEFRQTKYPVKPGHVVYENGDDTLSESYKRMMPACSIVSDTFGFAIGQTEKCKTPLAMAGRVLAYPLEDRNSYKPGDAVCSGPNGTVSKMTEEEKINHPECIIGYVSCVPNYETWGEKDTKVDGRIWIKVI